MSQAIDEAREALELVRTALGKRAFHVTEPHLSGHVEEDVEGEVEDWMRD